MLLVIGYYANKKKFPNVAVVATKLNFLQYTYRFSINHKTLYSQTFPGPHFGSWTTGVQSPNTLEDFFNQEVFKPCQEEQGPVWHV